MTFSLRWFPLIVVRPSGSSIHFTVDPVWDAEFGRAGVLPLLIAIPQRVPREIRTRSETSDDDDQLVELWESGLDDARSFYRQSRNN